MGVTDTGIPAWPNCELGLDNCRGAADYFLPNEEQDVTYYVCGACLDEACIMIEAEVGAPVVLSRLNPRP